MFHDRTSWTAWLWKESEVFYFRTVRVGSKGQITFVPSKQPDAYAYGHGFFKLPKSLRTRAHNVLQRTTFPFHFLIM